jgi:hypothetical protein
MSLPDEGQPEDAGNVRKCPQKRRGMTSSSIDLHGNTSAKLEYVDMAVASHRMPLERIRGKG